MKFIGLYYFKLRTLYSVVGISEQAVSQYRSNQEKKYLKYLELRDFVTSYRRSHPGVGLRKLYDQIEPDGIGRDNFVRAMQNMGLQLTSVVNKRRTTIPGHIQFPNLIQGMLVWKED